MRLPWKVFGAAEPPVASKNGTDRSTALSTQTTESSAETLWTNFTVELPSRRRLIDELVWKVDCSTTISALFVPVASSAWNCDVIRPWALKTGLSPSSVTSAWEIRMVPDQSPEV